MVVLCASLNNGCLQKMSSHHFVKEDQEPALIIADASAVSFEKIQELLEWSPTVIVMESSLEMVLSWGIKMDVADNFFCRAMRSPHYFLVNAAKAPTERKIAGSKRSTTKAHLLHL